MKFETNGLLCGFLLGFGLTGLGLFSGGVLGAIFGLCVAFGIIMLRRSD